MRNTRILSAIEKYWHVRCKDETVTRLGEKNASEGKYNTNIEAEN